MVWYLIIDDCFVFVSCYTLVRLWEEDGNSNGYTEIDSTGTTDH